jgi:Winged helix-turn-helix DNA-binding
VFMVTTTRNKLNPENETRMLSLEVNDSEEQTRAVLGKVAEVIGLNGEFVAADLQPWHDHQRWLAAGECEVIVPFAKTLSRLIKATRSVRLRRDFTQLLVAIQAHALLHRKHRERSNGLIVATYDDYAAVRELMADVLATASELKLREAVVETVQAVEEAAQGCDPGAEGAKVRDIADKLGLDRTATYRRLKAAEEAGFIENLEPAKGRAGRYRLTGETPVSGAELLPTVEALRQRCEAERRTAEPSRLRTPENARTAATVGLRTSKRYRKPLQQAPATVLSLIFSRLLRQFRRVQIGTVRSIQSRACESTNRWSYIYRWLIL